jgi:RNA polymerase sigma-70 factor (ECF subfamily)
MCLLDEIEAAIPSLRRYAHALMRDRDAADDLVQDGLERALSRRHLWRGEGPVRAWMFRILLNLHRDQLRQAPRRHLVPVESLPKEPSGPAGQEAHMDLREVQAAIGRLPDDQRHALLLVALEGMSLAEAAALLDIPEGTLVSRLGRARAALREMTGRTTPQKKEGRA